MALQREYLVLENLLLRHQLAILTWPTRTRPRIQLRTWDNLLWVLAYRFCAGWREYLTLVRPDTVVRWHRQGWRLFWRWKSRSRGGRPHLSPEVRDLIVTMSRDNRLWGTERMRAASRREIAQHLVAITQDVAAPHRREVRIAHVQHVVQVRDRLTGRVNCANAGIDRLTGQGQGWTAPSQRQAAAGRRSVPVSTQHLNRGRVRIGSRHWCPERAECQRQQRHPQQRYVCHRSAPLAEFVAALALNIASPLAGLHHEHPHDPRATGDQTRVSRGRGLGVGN